MNEKRQATRTSRASALGCALALSLLLGGCHLDMWQQPRYEPLEKSTFFEDGRASRPPVSGAYSYQGTLRPWSNPVFADITGERQIPGVLDAEFYTGRGADGLLEDNYFLNASRWDEPESDLVFEFLAHGRERYAVTCMPCHGLTGAGDGIIVQRGFPEPPSLHIERLREVEDGYFFDVITNGFGRMYSYASRVQPEDRWAIAAYIRALQFSQNVDPQTLPESEWQAIQAAMLEARQAAGTEQEDSGTMATGDDA